MLNSSFKLKIEKFNFKPGFLAEKEKLMKRAVPVLVSVFILFAVSMTFVAVDSSTAAEMKAMAAADVDLDAAKAIFEETCSKCHATSRALGKKKDQAGWESTVKRMASYHQRRIGSPIADEDQNAIVQYLVNVAGK